MTAPVTLGAGYCRRRTAVCPAGAGGSSWPASLRNSQADSFRATPGGHAKPVIAVLRHRRWWWSDGWVVYRHALLVEG
jgi:hypothetical protein